MGWMSTRANRRVRACERLEFSSSIKPMLRVSVAILLFWLALVPLSCTNHFSSYSWRLGAGRCGTLFLRSEKCSTFFFLHPHFSFLSSLVVGDTSALFFFSIIIRFPIDACELLDLGMQSSFLARLVPHATLNGDSGHDMHCWERWKVLQSVKSMFFDQPTVAVQT